MPSMPPRRIVGPIRSTPPGGTTLTTRPTPGAGAAARSDGREYRRSPGSDRTGRRTSTRASDAGCGSPRSAIGGAADASMLASAAGARDATPPGMSARDGTVGDADDAGGIRMLDRPATARSADGGAAGDGVPDVSMARGATAIPRIRGCSPLTAARRSRAPIRMGPGTAERTGADTDPAPGTTVDACVAGAANPPGTAEDRTTTGPGGASETSSPAAGVETALCPRVTTGSGVPRTPCQAAPVSSRPRRQASVMAGPATSFALEGRGGGTTLCIGAPPMVTGGIGGLPAPASADLRKGIETASGARSPCLRRSAWAAAIRRSIPLGRRFPRGLDPFGVASARRRRASARRMSKSSMDDPPSEPARSSLVFADTPAWPVARSVNPIPVTRARSP